MNFLPEIGSKDSPTQVIIGHGHGSWGLQELFSTTSIFASSVIAVSAYNQCVKQEGRIT